MVTKARALLALEVGFIACALVGVALIHVPAALILTGVLGVLAIERNEGSAK